jgi:hypothetical protein
MIRSKRRFAVLGVCGALLGLIALYTSASQAENGANWMVNGKNITATLLPIVQIKELVNKTIALNVTTAGGTVVEVLCTNAEFLNAKLQSEGSISSGNTTRFTGCLTKLNGTLSTACKPHDAEGKSGVVVSKPLKGLLVLHEGEPIIEFKPVTGEIFVVLLTSEACSIGEELPVTGTSTVQDANGKFTTEAVNHTVRQGPGSKLIFCGASAKVNGEAILALAGVEHTGLSWSALPG